MTFDPDMALQQTRQHFRALDLEVPAKLTEEIAAVDAMADNWQSSIVRPDPAQILADVWDAIEAGRDPMTDDMMRRLVTHQLWQLNLGSHFQQEARIRRAEVLKKYAPKILAAMAPIVEEADLAFAAARDALGSEFKIDLVGSPSPVQMPAWSRAKLAADNINRVTQVWRYVTESTGVASATGERTGLLILADLSSADIDALDGRPSIESLARSEHRLSLPSLEEFEQRVERFREQSDHTSRQRSAVRDYYAKTGDTDGAEARLVAIKLGGAR